MLPLERINKYTNEYGLSQRDAKILVKDKNISDYYQKAILLGVDPKSAANWLTSTIMGSTETTFYTIAIYTAY